MGDIKIYYAHSLALYGTAQERRDVELLELLGFEVENPNQLEHAQGYMKIKKEGGNPMDYFVRLVTTCDALAFRGLPTGHIPAGVYKEIRTAENNAMPVFELPCFFNRAVGVEETRQFLREIGER